MSEPALFPLPDGARVAPRRVVLLAGASGSGKTRLTRTLGLPVVALDDFYLDLDHPDLPHRFGIVDWDSPASWDADAATAALTELATRGAAEVPVYDISTSRRTGHTRVDAGDARVVVAEGIFASELVDRLSDAGLLADAICLVQPRLRTFWRRLLRDLGESRKPPSTLVRRGWSLLREEPRLVARWTAQGCRPLSPTDAERAIRTLAS